MPADPGTGESFYRRASEPAIAGQPPLPVDFGRIAEAAQATGAIEVLGPAAVLVLTATPHPMRAAR